MISFTVLLLCFFENCEQNIDEKNSNKYIVYECKSNLNCGGWADRLKGKFLSMI